MRWALNLLAAYIRRYFIQWFAWRSFAVTLVINQVLPPLIGLAVWRTAFPHDPGVSTYFAALLVVRLMTVSYENHTFSGRIFNGELADDLLRPHPVFLQSMGENIALRIWHVIIGIPLVICVSYILPIEPTWHDITLSLPAVILSAALQYLFTFILAMSAFWTGRANSIVSVGSTLVFLLSGVAIPVMLMPAGIQAVAMWLPFRSMMGFPAEVATGLLDPREILLGYTIQTIWLLVLGVAVYTVWMNGIRKFTAAGA